MDFETVRWKLADTLTPEEGEFIVANKDKLNDEEKAAFADVLQAAEPLPDLEKVIDATANADPENPVEPVTPAPVADPVTPPAVVAPVIPDNVVTQDKLDSYLTEKRKEWEAEGQSKEQQKEKEKEAQQLFDSGYLPKDWNDYSTAFLEKVSPIIEARVLATLDKQNKINEDNQNKIRQTQKEVFDRFETEFATLAKSKLIPDPVEKPDEYAKVHAAILKMGDENGKTNVTDAYKLWSIIPVEHGGGLATGAPVVTPEEKIDQQKDAAGRIGSGRGAPTISKAGPPDAAVIHNTSLEDLVANRLMKP